MEPSLVTALLAVALAAPPVAAGDVVPDQDPGASEPHGWWVGSVEKEGRLFVFAALVERPGASGMVCRPMAERALAALGVLPAR